MPTRMHSSRMRTACLLMYPGGLHPGRGAASRGGLYLEEGVCLGGSASRGGGSASEGSASKGVCLGGPHQGDLPKVCIGQTPFPHLLTE